MGNTGLEKAPAGAMAHSKNEMEESYCMFVCVWGVYVSKKVKCRDRKEKIEKNEISITHTPHRTKLCHSKIN